MVPIYNSLAARLPYSVSHDPSTELTLERHGETISSISFLQQPQFYNLTTTDGVPYWKIALLHSRDVLATTVLQTCIRYGNTATSCQFCAIEQSLEVGRKIARKTPT